MMVLEISVVYLFLASDMGRLSSCQPKKFLLKYYNTIFTGSYQQSVNYALLAYTLPPLPVRQKSRAMSKALFRLPLPGAARNFI